MSYYHPFCFCFMLCLDLQLLHLYLEFVGSPCPPQQPRGQQFSKLHFLFTLEYGVRNSPVTKPAPHSSPRAALQRAAPNPGFIFHTGNGNSAAHGSEMLSRALEETWGCLWTAMSRTKSLCAFEKTWEIRNRSTTISFSRINPFQRFLNSFVLSLNRKKKKRKNFTVPLPST